VRVLIQNSDSPDNRGDRAILAGVIELARGQWPDAEIWSLSTEPERDEAWFGIRFLKQSPYSTNPLRWIQLLALAQRSDVVLWGGGEILKDYTNRLGLFYWLVKVVLLSLVNRNVIGAFQGIGPTNASMSRKIIRMTVNRTRVFVVRDHESREKLLAWDVRVPVIESFDPAILATPAVFDESLQARLKAETGISAKFLRNSVGFGLRRWFHYRRGGWIPVKFRFWKPAAVEVTTAEFETYVVRVARLADRLIENNGVNVVFFPMHLNASEGDVEFAATVVARMRNPKRARLIDSDTFSPAEFAGIISQLRAFFASRLHSSILATVTGVPSFVLYYVDKGRLFFEQLGLERWSAPIESILEPGAVKRLAATVEELLADGDAARLQVSAARERMADRVRDDFAAAAGSQRGTAARGQREPLARVSAEVL
jgi:polysaccharide pyruvyl transferase WcaK-like protein